ncbi:sigma-54 interaction domain-containing protein [Stigmatella erecta]|uniref:Transcriptional regulator containing PAS, AAA-type ATPase, and DNA-binding Fis domains n=1 Tax=Stigmatella erecta TaxID=83460 RepID=A0A1I0KRQ6_9BACT|nr:sigma 54-interacting transcriptional regulator [Stigmatella erecta]SEU28340.1 Transcriptional regulator containing PAS, AAA-type ATPase, and DNA-binding Fis domains [Stigmatella erecta]
MSRKPSSTDGFHPLEPFTGERPLGSRLEEARMRFERGRGPRQVLAALECAVLAALVGRRPEAESFLLRGRSVATRELEGPVELASALVLLEAGYSARVAGALERAESLPGTQEEPALRALCLVLYAQVLLLDGMSTAAVRASLEGLDQLPPGEEESPLAVHAHLVAAEALLEAGNLPETMPLLEKAARMASCTGLLAARTEVLRVRWGLAQGAPRLEELRATLDRATGRFELLEASRDLALAHMLQASLVAKDASGSPGNWLARAHPLLVKVGTAKDLRLLRQAFRTFSPHKANALIDTDLFSVMEELRERHARLKDILSAQRDARSSEHPHLAALPSPLAKLADGALESVHLTEEALIRALEHTLLERERLGLLVVVSQHLAGIEELEELLTAIPRLALGLIPAAVAGLVELDDNGTLQEFQEGLLPPELPTECFRDAVHSAFQQRAPQLILDKVRPSQPGRGAPQGQRALIPLHGQSRKRLGLVLGLSSARTGLSERDFEQLSVFGSLCGAALMRIRDRIALEQAAARDAATLAAIRDGVLTLDHAGLVCALNHSAARLLRVQPAQLVGRSLRSLAALEPLGEALKAGRPLLNEVIALPHGELLVCTQMYEGGVVATLQELASAQRLAHKLTGAQARFTFEDLLGEDPAFLACLKDARQAARSDVPILITGESGTGKELLAQAIHRASPSAASPFVGINMAAFPRELLESELFGYERGAFTGARAGGNPGKFELADRGTLLLDEIGDMPLEMQVKLLRVLQERTFQRLGGTRDLSLQARVVATTHRDLERAIDEGNFRLDLFHRLRAVHLRLPPLRERRGDIPRLVDYHLRRYTSRLHRRPLQVAPHVMADLMAYDWPGNVRELANLLEGAASLLLDDQDVLVRTPPAIARALQQHTPSPAAWLPGCPSAEAPVLPFAEVERRAFEQALRHCGGNVARAAKALGVAKATFYSKIRRYGLVQEPEPGRAPFAAPHRTVRKNAALAPDYGWTVFPPPPPKGAR